METNNKLIAEFMGLVKEDDSYSSGKSIEYKKGAFVDYEAMVEGVWFKYHTSLEALEPVIEEIGDILFKNMVNFGYSDDCLNSEDIETRYIAVIEFINWYNEIAYCSVCNTRLMHDDECYNDEKTGEPLCDSHSAFNEETGNYYKSAYPFKEGDDYWTIDKGKVVWSCWDDISEEMHDENPNKVYYTTKEEAIKNLTVTL